MITKLIFYNICINAIDLYIMINSKKVVTIINI